MEQQFFVSEIKCNFNLRQPHGCRPTPIYFVVRINGRQLKFATGVKVCPSLWNKKAQIALVSHKLSKLENHNNSIVNCKISLILERFSEFKSYLCSHIEELSNCESILIYFLTKKTMEKLDIYKYLIDKVNADENITSGTAVTYKDKLRRLADFLNFKKKQGQEITSFQELANSRTFAEYQQYLSKVAKNNKNGRQLTVRYVNDVIKNLHTVLKYAIADGLLDRTQWANTTYELTKNKTSTDNEIYLRDDEIMMLYNYQCESKTDELAKDIFLLECLTGQRISDVKELDDGIDENGVITLIQKKTNKKVRFCLVFEMANKILIDKYKRNIPSLSNTVINKRIKEIAKAAGIEGQETISIHYIGNAKPTVIHKERWECITTHTGRRTFTSLLFLRNWNIDRICKYTGHNDIRSVERYNKLTDVDYTYFKRLQKKHPELILRMVDDVPLLAESVLTKEKQDDKTETLNDLMFAETTLLQLQEMSNKGIDIYELPETKSAIKTIKSMKYINRAKTIIQVMEPEKKDKLIERLDQLRSVIYEIAKETIDTELYKIYKFKMQTIGADCKIPTDDFLLTAWHGEKSEEMET